MVTDDTKTYLYLDPGRYVRQALSLWDPHVGLGTVTHENIGYLLPMGPFYWFLAELHVPLWVAQRLWMGCLLYAAGAGALYLCRVLGLSGPGRYVTSLAFMFTPYVLQYSGRISVILMPWAGLPWMLAFVVLALRKGGWRYPALFALVVALVSGINASSILYVGIAPALWLPYAVLVTREATWRKAWGVAWKVAGLTILVSLWWAVGLQIEAAYGVNVLKYTETVPATSGASLASEILRGLGYWYFYGTDRVGPWTQTSLMYTQNVALILWSFSVPALAFLAAFVARWRYRSYFILITVVGMVMAVGPNPYGAPLERGRGHQEDHGGHHRRPGHALDRPGLPADHPVDGHLPGRRRQRAQLPGPQDRPGHRGLRGGRRGRGLVTAVVGPDHRQRLHPAGRAPGLHPGGGHRSQLCPSGHPRLRPARQQLRRLAVGRHHRHRVPGTHDPAVRDPRAADHGVTAHRGRAGGRGRSAPERGHGLERHGPDGIAAQRGRRARPVRPGLRALRHPEPADSWPPSWPPPPPGLVDPVSYGTPRPNVSLLPHFDEGITGPAGQPGLAVAAGVLHGDRPPTHRPHRVDGHSPGGGR